MEYNDFLRLYYNETIEQLMKVKFEPSIVCTYDGENIPLEYFNKKDSGYFGPLRLKLEAPNEVYEQWFEEQYETYPEFMLLFLPKERLIEKSKNVNSIEEIQKTISVVINLYNKAGLIGVEDAI